DKGDKGEDGLSCSASQIENNDGTKTTTITCETAEGESAEYVVNDGKDGTSCSISDKGNGVVKLICGDNSVNLKEPMCGSTPYDPEKWICFGDGELIQNTASSTATSSAAPAYSSAAAPIISSASYSSEAAPSSSASVPSSSAVPEVFEYSSSAAAPITSSAAPSCEETVKGSYIDTRDNHEYKTVTIGDRTWFAENIQYGATSVKTKEHTSGGQLLYYGVIGVCPEGWRLPSKADFEDLIARATCGGTGDPSKVLRSTTWDGTDELGFNVVPAGNCGTTDCWNSDKYTAFWTTDADPVALRTYTTLSFDYANDDPDTEKMFLGETKTDFGISIRCVKDKEE
ncbi:MAG: FISUMP domain-containing protein, partial [Fibrobacter sp.]|nr:FISUMP domain-containing protein [Fibrobacter sp.]